MNTEYEPEWSDYVNQFNLSPEAFQSIPETTSKYCVIVEPRCSDLLPAVIKNFMYLLQHKGWGLLVFHGIENEEFVKTALTGWSGVHYIQTGVSNFNSQTYSAYLSGPAFWEVCSSFGCQYALIFQCDTVLLKDNVDDFIGFDYVGAPWGAGWTGVRGHGGAWFDLGLMHVGNGGLSLRNVPAMLEITKKYPFAELAINEDMYFSHHCLSKGYKVPSLDVAKTFAVETLYYSDPCGMHQPHVKNFPNRESYSQLLSKRFV
jgi:hypothetical protein